MDTDIVRIGCSEKAPPSIGGGANVLQVAVIAYRADPMWLPGTGHHLRVAGQ